jgi:TrkA-C domain
MDLLEFPGAAEVFSFAGGRIRLLGFTIDTGAAMVGKRFSDLRAMEPGFKVLITAIVRGEKLIVPSGGSVIEGGDYLFAVTDATRVHLQRDSGRRQMDPLLLHADRPAGDLHRAGAADPRVLEKVMAALEKAAKNLGLKGLV